MANERFGPAKCIVILVCVLSVGVRVRAVDLQQISQVLGTPLDDLEECLAKNHLKSDDIKRIESVFLNSNVSPDEIETYIRNISCFVSCGFEKSNIMKDSKIQLNTVLELTERNNFSVGLTAKKKLMECIDLANGEPDKCDAAFSFLMCFLQQMRYH